MVWRKDALVYTDPLSGDKIGGPTAAVTWRTAEGKQKTLNYRAGCGGPEGRALIPALRAAMQFDQLVWSEDRFAPDGSR